MANISDELVEQVWQKAKIVANNNPNVFRKDYAGAWIRRDQFGRTDLPYGWEVDHCKPLSKGGTDDLSNLYPLHWRNNRKKGDDFPNWKTALTSDGVKNVEEEFGWHM